MCSQYKVSASPAQRGRPRDTGRRVGELQKLRRRLKPRFSCRLDKRATGESLRIRPFGEFKNLVQQVIFDFFFFEVAAELQQLLLCENAALKRKDA